MKIRPVILCGGAGTRLWSNAKKHQAKQFIDFGNWTLFGKTLERVRSSIFDTPIISTNTKYIKEVKKHLKKYKIKKYKIILEPAKKNTAPAILSTTLIKDIPDQQPIIFLTADHLIEKTTSLNTAMKKSQKELTQNNIFIFGIKPTIPSSEFGYFLTKNIKGNINKVTRFIEKPKEAKARQIIKNNGYWNSGMFFSRKDSIINNFKRYQPQIFKNCNQSVTKAKYKKNIYYLNKKYFTKVNAKSFDNAILENIKNIKAIKLNIEWSDLGSWKEILKMFSKKKKTYIRKKNIFYRPWGKFINLFKGKEFLIKELHINPKGILSLQKHNYRSEHWFITKGSPLITLNNNQFLKKQNEHIFIPVKSKHRIQNLGNKTVKIIEAQIGSLLKETDIIRYKDIYGRVK